MAFSVQEWRAKLADTAVLTQGNSARGTAHACFYPVGHVRGRLVRSRFLAICGLATAEPMSVQPAKAICKACLKLAPDVFEETVIESQGDIKEVLGELAQAG